MKEWKPINDQVPEGVVFNTIISDENGLRNEAKLKRKSKLWFYPDDSMYVYYTPTHYKENL